MLGADRASLVSPRRLRFATVKRGVRLGLCLAAIGLALVGSRGEASATPRTHAVASHAGHAGRGEKAEPAQSIGPPNAGRLEGAVRLKGSHTLQQREGAHSWGLPQLVKLLHHAADRVARKHKGSVL